MPYMPNELFKDLLGGVLSGAIGFLSAIGVILFQEFRLKQKRPGEILLKIEQELAKNWFSLACDIKGNKVGIHQLSNLAWGLEAAFECDLKDENLVGSLELLYKEITSYNNLCDMGRTERLYNLKQGRLTAIDRLNSDDGQVPKALLGR